MTSASRRFAVAATIAASALFATSATARAVSGVQVDSVTLAAVRLLIGAIGLVTWAMMRGRQTNLIQLWRNPLIWVMAFGVAGYQALFFIGTGRVGVAIGTLASLALGPIMAGGLAWSIGGKAPNRIWWYSTMVSIAGLTMLTFGSSVNSNFDLLGIFAAVGAGTAYAIYTVLGTRLAQQGWLGSDVLAASFIVGAVLLLPFGVPHLVDLLSVRGVGLALWLGLVATTLAYLGFAVGISRLTAGTVATLNLAEPVIATLLGIFVVGESVSTFSLFGAGLIALALGVLAKKGAE